jgi:hypothetical protein
VGAGKGAARRDADSRPGASAPVETDAGAGRYSSVAGLSNAEQINKGYVSRLLNLTLLAPDIVEAILDGRQPKGMMLKELARGLAPDWQQQRDLINL